MKLNFRVQVFLCTSPIDEPLFCVFEKVCGAMLNLVPICRICTFYKSFYNNRHRHRNDSEHINVEDNKNPQMQ